MTLASVLHNPYIIGSLGLSAGTLIGALRELPKMVWEGVERLFTCSVQVSNIEDGSAYLAVRAWLCNQECTHKARNLTASLSMESSRWQVVPAPGSHFFLFGGIPVWVRRDRNDRAENLARAASPIVRDMITIRMLTRNKNRLMCLLNEVQEHLQSQATPDGYMRVWLSDYGSWHECGGLRVARPLDSVILPFGDVERIVDDVQAFFKSENRYRASGIPYRRGWLLYGTPGTGKTSLVSALAGHFKRDIHILSLSDSYLTDGKLLSLFTSIPKGSFVLLEDIDSAFATRDSKKDGITFSGLLNVLDGVASPEGSVLFMTTNRVEQLDEALIRPGRIDRRMCFQGATVDQLERLHLRLAGELATGEWVKSYVGKPISEAQVAILGAQ